MKKSELEAWIIAVDAWMSQFYFEIHERTDLDIPPPPKWCDFDPTAEAPRPTRFR